jgi:hypothetical protein
VPEAHSPAARGSGSPLFLSPPALFWICSSIRSLTYSNIHSVTRGHRGKDTIGILSCQRVEVLKEKIKRTKQNHTQNPQTELSPFLQSPLSPNVFQSTFGMNLLRNGAGLTVGN